MIKAGLDTDTVGCKGILDLHFDTLVQVSGPHPHHGGAQGHIFLKADPVHMLADTGGGRLWLTLTTRVGVSAVLLLACLAIQGPQD